MLTWKSFLLIMFVTSLTLVNVNSSDQPSSSNPRRRNLPRSEPRVNTSEFTILNPDNNRYYTYEYNNENHFIEGTFEYKCYQQIRLFCDTDIDRLKSSNCVKKAVLYYKSNFKGVTIQPSGQDIIWDLLPAVHDFFYNFPLRTDNVLLPRTFCIDPDTDMLDNSCTELDKRESNMTGRVLDIAIQEAQDSITKYALLHKLSIGMTQGSFEIKYLQHISNVVKTADETHFPYDYCRNYLRRYHAQTQLRLG